MRFFQDFKDFAVRGNVLDMGIGVVLGTAFGKIVDSLVNDMIMPPVGLFLGRADFSNFYLNLSGGSYKSLSEAKEAGVATLNYGIFFNTVLHFTIVSFATFIMIRQINKIRKVPLESLGATKQCSFCFSTISVKAIRCPHCTSIISGNDGGDNGPDIRVNIKAS
jgi:large conductance mechanosensitive channel